MKVYEFKTNWEYLDIDIYKIKALIYASSKNRAWSVLYNKLNEIRLEYEDAPWGIKKIQKTKLIFKNMSINKFEIEEYELMEVDGNNYPEDRLKSIYEGYIPDFKMEKYKYNGGKEEWFHYDKHDYYTGIRLDMGSKKQSKANL